MGCFVVTRADRSELCGRKVVVEAKCVDADDQVGRLRLAAAMSMRLPLSSSRRLLL